MYHEKEHPIQQQAVILGLEGSRAGLLQWHPDSLIIWTVYVLCTASSSCSTTLIAPGALFFKRIGASTTFVDACIYHPVNDGRKQENMTVTEMLNLTSSYLLINDNVYLTRL